MKYFLPLLFIAVTLSTIAKAQKTQPGYTFGKGVPINFEQPTSGNSAIKAATVIWSDDFSSPSNWTFLSDTNEWFVADTLPSELVSQGFDSTINSASGGMFAFINSDGAGQGQVQDAFITYNNTIDCSQFSTIHLVFDNYFRQFNDERTVFVSNDGITWDSIPVFGSWPSGVTSSNPEQAIIDISTVAANQDSVRIKFKYHGEWDWFWAIDDIYFVVPPDNELTLETVFYNGVSDPTRTTYYTKVPIRQAISDSLRFGAEIVNNGAVDQSNTKMFYNVERGGTQIFSSTTAPVTVAAGQTATSEAALSWTANSTGAYRFDFLVQSDSIFNDHGTNSGYHEFEVGLNEYYRDNDTVDQGNWLNTSNDIWEMLLAYDIHDSDTIFGISVMFPNLTNGYGLKEGDVVEYFIYQESNLVQPVATSTPHQVQAGEENDWLSLGMPQLAVGNSRYFVGFRVNNDSIAVGTNTKLNTTIATHTVLGRTNVTDDSDPWFYTESFMPFIRIFTANPNTCDSINIVLTETVNDNQTTGTIDLDVSGGHEPYSFLWSAVPDTSYSSTEQNPNNIEKQGTYTVTVTDLFGCTAEKSMLVGGIVSVAEINFTSNIFIYPNPASNSITLSGTISNAGLYELKIVNITGQVIDSQIITTGINLYKSVDVSSLRNGVYFLILSDKENSVPVGRFIRSK